MKRHKINYNIDLFSEDNKLINSFHNRIELEDFMKLGLNGSNTYYEVAEFIESISDAEGNLDTTRWLEQVEKYIYILDKTVSKEVYNELFKLGYNFYDKYWVNGSTGIQEFMYQIEDACINHKSFMNLTWKFQKYN